MDRKGIIAIVLSLVVLVWWQIKTQREIQEWRQQHPELAATESGTPAASPTAADGTPALPPPSAASPASPADGPQEPEVPEEILVAKTPLAEYRFTNLGGGIVSVSLLEHEGDKDDERVVVNSVGRHPIATLLDDPASTARAPAYTLTQEGNKVIARRTQPNGIEIVKTYTLPETEKEAYTTHLNVTFTNQGAHPFEKAGYALYVGGVGPIHANELAYYIGFDWHRAGKTKRISPSWFDASRIPLLGIERSPAKPQYLETPGEITWLGVKSQYFTSLITNPQSDSQGVWGKRLLLQHGETQVQGVEAALIMAPFKVAAGASHSHDFTLYTGPKEYSRLKALGQGQADLMDFGVFKWVCIFLLGSMKWLQGYLGSYALAIIVLTFIVRGALWPVQGKANQSMKRMQQLQPKMAELREKYKDDPTKMNQELMSLYKDYGVNPFAGCLPMLIQIPIFFGFYSMLGTAVELRNSSFFWVSDLSQPDTVAYLLGFPINILPLLMAATMILQMQLTPKSGDPMQQRIFMFMPLIFLVFTYNFASALALYYTVQNILSILQLYLTRNDPMPELVKRDKRPAKPAKPAKPSKRTTM